MKFFHTCLLLALLLLNALPSKAVLQEDSLKNSLAVLRHELITSHYQLNEQTTRAKQLNSRVTQQLKDITQRSSQVSLMLYSQNSEYIFDVTYACHQATTLYNEFETKTRPFSILVERSKQDIARYDSLINSLSTMYTEGMTEREKIDRNVCLTLAVSIRRMLTENNQNFQDYIQYYNYTRRQLKELNDYAQKRYQDIQGSLLRNTNENYFSILLHPQYYILRMVVAYKDKYVPDNKVKSQWDASWLLLLLAMVAFYGLCAVLVNFLSIRFLATRLIKSNRWHIDAKAFLTKRTCIIINGTVITFGLALLLIRYISPSNFVYMATGILLEFTWLLVVIFTSLMLRVDGELIRNTYRSYYPIIFVGAVIISFRIILIPAVFVNIMLPPLMLIATLWQGHIIKKYRLLVMRNDLYLCYATLTVFIVATATSWMGYTMLSVQIIIWWMMQLACILTIACAHDYLNSYREKHKLASKPISKTWFFRLVYSVVLPSCMVLSFLFAVYWATDVFNLSELTWNFFSTDLINTENIKVSIFGIAVVVAMWFVFSYINHTSKDLINFVMEQRDPTTAATRSVMFVNVTQTVVWGTWLLLSLAVFKVNNTWLVVVSGGLSTGIGFAMKDILENIYYGISLMAGRIKIGDYVVCDGIRGRVTSISYTSTMLEAVDGSVIAFQNSQLFTKNYKNLTKNHGYELDTLEVGVAYGTNIKECCSLLTEAVTKLKCIYHNRPVAVRLKSFDDSCVTLMVLFWVNVLDRYSAEGEIMECIYDTLNEHNIEIPFPQREITLKNVAELRQESPTPPAE